MAPGKETRFGKVQLETYAAPDPRVEGLTTVTTSFDAGHRNRSNGHVNGSNGNSDSGGADKGNGNGTVAIDALSAVRVMTTKEYARAYVHGYPMTLRFLLSRGIQAETAEEAAQDAWAKGWEHRGKLREPGKVLSWVNTIALNQFRNSLRRREIAGPLPDVAVPPRASATSIDLVRALDQCKSADRELLEKHYLGGHTSLELGQEMRVSAVAIRVRILRVRRQIQKKIGRYPMRPATPIGS